ncbi:MAG: DNA repair protein RecO [Bryobacteraceae bacterium]
MSARVCESIILRTYALREADLIVSFFTRDLGKLRGVARRARKPGNRFGSGLQRLSHVRMYFFHRENRELDSLDSCELIHSQFALGGQYELSVGMDFMAEIADHLLPAGEPNERFFRLLVAVTGHMAVSKPDGQWTARLWEAVNYFALWSVRLSGFLAPMELSNEDRIIAEEMLHTPVHGLTPRAWSRSTAIGLRRQLIGLIEQQIERRLLTTQYLETL